MDYAVNNVKANADGWTVDHMDLTKYDLENYVHQK
jgi:hypothetical protein